VRPWRNRHKLEKDSEANTRVISLEKTGPTPIPMLRRDSKWEFDAAAGLDEVIGRTARYRRKGGRTEEENEMAAIQYCRAYAAFAQWEGIVVTKFTSPKERSGTTMRAEYDAASTHLALQRKTDGLFGDTAANDEKPASRTHDAAVGAEALRTKRGQLAGEWLARGGGAETETCDG